MRTIHIWNAGAVVIDGTKIVKAGTLSEVKAAYPDAELFGCKGQGDHAGLYQCTRTYFTVHSQEDCPSKDMTQRIFRYSTSSVRIVVVCAHFCPQITSYIMSFTINYIHITLFLLLLPDQRCIEINLLLTFPSTFQ